MIFRISSIVLIFVPPLVLKVLPSNFAIATPLAFLMFAPSIVPTFEMFSSCSSLKYGFNVIAVKTFMMYI
jgi:hypothetical protein